MGGSDLETAAARRMQQELLSQRQQQSHHQQRQERGAGARGGGEAAPPPSDSARASSLPGTLREALQRANLEQQMAQIAGAQACRRAHQPMGWLVAPLPSYKTGSGPLAYAHLASSAYIISDPVELLSETTCDLRRWALQCQLAVEPVFLAFAFSSYFTLLSKTYEKL